MAGQGADGPGQGLGAQGRAVHRAPFLGAEEVAHALGDEGLRRAVLRGAEPAEPVERVVGPDVPHDGEEVGQGGDAVGVVGPHLDG